MGRKIEAAESAALRALAESMAKIKSGRHKNDDYENGYAQAMYDISQIISKLK